jgi:oligogalacturonide transport system substrate-binding protein
MIDKGVTQPFEQANLFKDAQETNPKWISDNLGMTIKHCSLLNKFIATGKDIGTATLPIMANAKDTGVVISVGSVLSINAASKYQAEAADFINWFINDKAAVESLGEVRGTHPTVNGRKVLDDAKLSNPVVTNAVNVALANASSFAENGISQNQEFEALFIDAIEQVAFAQMTPEQAADYVINSLNSKLNDMKP